MVPTAAPIASAARIGTTCLTGSLANTVTQAITAPVAPIRLPPRAVRGPESPLSAMMKHTAASR